eukprot:6401267-Pyramimonas_sp.AAC.1
MAPRGHPMPQDGLQESSRYHSIAQYDLYRASKTPQEGHKTVAGALKDPSGPPREAKILQQPGLKSMICAFLPFAPDEFLKRQ